MKHVPFSPRKYTFFQKDDPVTLGFRQPRQCVMTLPEFFSIPANPRQRNTALRLNKATQYLENPSPAQMVVHVAVLPNSSMVKLDGHTRAMYWEKNPDHAPGSVIAMLYDVRGEAEAAELYTHFDNLKAAETPRDQWTGAFREIGFTPTNSRLQRGTGGYGLKIAHNAHLGLTGPSSEKPYAIVKHWEKELLLADRISKMGAKQIHTGIWVAMFASLKRYGEAALPFWEAFFSLKGVADGESMDAVMYLLIKRSQMGRSKAAQDSRLSAIALGCFRRWYNGNRLLGRTKTGNQQNPDPISVVDFLAPIRVLSRQLSKAA